MVYIKKILKTKQKALGFASLDLILTQHREPDGLKNTASYNLDSESNGLFQTSQAQASEFSHFCWLTSQHFPELIFLTLSSCT